MVNRGSGKEGKGNYCLMGSVSAWDDEKVLELGNDDGCTTL